MVRYQTLGTLRKTPDQTGASRIFIYTPLLALIVLGFFSQDQQVYFFGAFVFACFFFLLLDTHVPPVILFSFVFEWFFNQGQLFAAILEGLPVKQLKGLNYKPNVDQTIFLGLLATSTFFLAMYLTARNVRILSLEQTEAFFKRININRLLKVYLWSLALIVVSGGFIWRYPGLVQPVYLLIYFRWSIFFLLFCTVYFQGKFHGVLLLLILADFLFGFLSFFANFKEVIFFSFISYWIFYFQSSRVARIFLALTFFFMIYVGSLWSYVKQDYREFLNMGTGSHYVRVGRVEALNKFVDLTSAVSWDEINDGFDQLLLRLSWIGAFNSVHNHVPSKVPHTDGELWKEGLVRPFMPRVLFPEKKIIADSKELNTYSGLHVNETSTSISLSMIAGSYVDFGEWGMLVPLFLFGLFCGWIYRTAVRWGRYPFVGYALTVPMIYLLKINEQSINRTISSVVLYFVVLWFIKQFLLDSFLNYIIAPRPNPTSDEASLG